MALVIPYLSVVSLNVNGLTSLIKRHSRSIKKKQKTPPPPKDPTICCLQGINFSFKDTQRLKVRDGKKSSMQMRTWIATLRYIDFNSSTAIKE